MYEEIVNKILSLLQADRELSGKVKKWFFGFPVEPQVFPYVAVRFRGCRVTAETTLKKRCEMVFEVLVVDTSLKEDKAEKSVLNLTEKIDQVLTGNPNLDGLVDHSYVGEIETDVGFLEKGGVMVGVLITLTAFKSMTGGE